MVVDPKKLLEKQKEIVGRVDYKRGIDPSLQQHLVEEVNKIKKLFPGAGLAEPSTVKRFRRALEKVDNKHHGDWTQINDLACCTLVVRKESELEPAKTAVKKHFRTVSHATSVRNTLQFVEERGYKPGDTPADLEKNPCNYSGDSIIVRTRDFRRAEIQINYAAMQYAKSLPEFRAAFGPQAETEMEGKFAPVPGGLGHKMYEEWRRKPNDTVGKNNAAACRLYFNYFRSPVRTPDQWDKVLEALRNLNRTLFRSTG